MTDIGCELCFHLPEKGCFVRAKGDLAVAAPCEGCAKDCDICGNERFLVERDERGYEFVAPCACARLLDRIRYFNGAQIPARYSHCTLSTFIGHKDGNQREVHRRTQKHIDRFYPKSKGLLFSGTVGTGKTHLMTAILRDLTLKRGVRSRFVEFSHLLSDIKEGFSQGKNEAEVISPIAQLPVLGIDELGKGTATDWQLSVLDEVISRRYNLGLTTYFTTNLPISNDEKGRVGAVTAESKDLRRSMERVSLEDRVGPRIFSRLFEMCEFVTVLGPDARRQGASQ